MNRYDLIKNEIYRGIEDNCYGSKKLHGYSHLFGVSTLCILLAPKFDLDPEITGVMGLLHDYSEFKTGSSFDHANRSSFLANGILSKTRQFSISEVTTITTAIKNHSLKDQQHDKYSEFLKLCDVLYSHINEPDKVLGNGHEHYINIAKEKGFI